VLGFSPSQFVKIFLGFWELLSNILGIYPIDSDLSCLQQGYGIYVKDVPRIGGEMGRTLKGNKRCNGAPRLD
jgi:hypothetical protein